MYVFSWINSYSIILEDELKYIDRSNCVFQNLKRRLKCKFMKTM